MKVKVEASLELHQVIKKMFINMIRLRQRSNLFLIIFMVSLISCGQSSVVQNDSDQTEEISLRKLLKLYTYANTYNLNDSDLFIFLKECGEYHDSWVYIITEEDTCIDVEFRVLPSFTKTGYDSYMIDSNQFLFYECYKIRLNRDLWDDLLRQSEITSKAIKDTIDIDEGFSLPNYFLWYKSQLLVCRNSRSKYISQFEQLEKLLKNSIYKKIEYRRNNPNIKFKNGPLLPQGKLTDW